MEAVIDPSSSMLVGFISRGALRVGGPWASFITLPVPDDADQETLGITYDSESQTYIFIVDPTKVQAKTAAAWSSVRAQQKQKLYESDWTCSVTDYGVPDKELWVTYRQALRDVTKQGDPFNIEWPTPPASA